jgi:hypothetical protein
VLSSSPGLSSEFYCQIKWLNLRHRRQKGDVKMKGNADELAYLITGDLSIFLQNMANTASK